MYADLVNAAVARMDADIEAVFELFGAEAENPSSLLDKLPRDGDTARGGGRLTNWGVGGGWIARAARVLRDVTADCEVTLRQCAEQAFDDPDPRVRGVAWCVLARLLDHAATTNSVEAIIADEFKRRVAGAPNDAEHHGDASAFAVMVTASVSIASGRHIIKAIEQEYIDCHAGCDAALISSSPSTAVRFLDHPDSGRRLAALVTVSHADRHGHAVCAAVRRLMMLDPDPDVCVAAIEAYGRIFQDSSDPECLRYLAEIVLDEGQPRRSRFEAYTGLFVVSDRVEFPLRCADIEKIVQLRDGGDDTDWPTPINWKFVRHCAEP